MEFLEFTDVLLRLAMMKVQHAPLILDPLPLAPCWLGQASGQARPGQASCPLQRTLSPICATSLGRCTSLCRLLYVSCCMLYAAVRDTNQPTILLLRLDEPVSRVRCMVHAVDCMFRACSYTQDANQQTMLLDESVFLEFQAAGKLDTFLKQVPNHPLARICAHVTSLLRGRMHPHTHPQVRACACADHAQHTHCSLPQRSPTTWKHTPQVVLPSLTKKGTA